LSYLKTLEVMALLYRRIATMVNGQTVKVLVRATAVRMRAAYPSTRSVVALQRPLPVAAVVPAKRQNGGEVPMGLERCVTLVSTYVWSLGTSLQKAKADPFLLFTPGGLHFAKVAKRKPSTGEEPLDDAATAAAGLPPPPRHRSAGSS
jgi:hypothetical protein